MHQTASFRFFGVILMIIGAACTIYTAVTKSSWIISYVSFWMVESILLLVQAAGMRNSKFTTGLICIGVTLLVVSTFVLAFILAMTSSVTASLVATETAVDASRYDTISTMVLVMFLIQLQIVGTIKCVNLTFCHGDGGEETTTVLSWLQVAANFGFVLTSILIWVYAEDRLWVIGLFIGLNTFLRGLDHLITGLILPETPGADAVQLDPAIVSATNALSVVSSEGTPSVRYV
jgi:hypothetical protein